MESNFEYLCRVCAVNTKGKNSVAECVYILKTPGLKDKIERFLYLTISEDDIFSKVLCKTCFRQVEATASLSNIAKHTQQVFRDFLFSTLPKQLQSSAYNVNITASNAAAASTSGANGANGNYQQQTCQTGQTSFSSGEILNFRPLVLSKAPETTITLAPPAANLSHPNRDEVVISLMKKTNETRPRTKNTAIQQRRNSVFDTRYLNAPVSIAQRGLLPPPVPSTSSNQKKLSFEIIPTSTSKSNVGLAVKKPSPSGVINFIQTHGKVTGSANGYSLLNNMPNSVIQQKRKNLKMALNNIKAVNSGQVSLLKPKQTLQATEDKSKLSVSVTTVQMNKTLVDESTSIEECLPENIIIAAPKKKRDDNAPESPPPIDPTTLRLPTKADLKAKQRQQPTHPQKQSIKQTQASSKPVPKVTSDINSVSNLTDGISLGGVIRDPDLLKLILKSLKWPVNKSNFEDQMTRLKNAKFAEIISDSNLLQDTDVTQLLGPYIAPVLHAAQAYQQKQPIAEQPSKTIAKTNKNVRTASAKQKPQSQSQDQLQSSDDLANTMPYKLPPETSVQLVPSSPTEQDVMPTLTITNRKESKSISKQRNQRRMRTRENSLIISPEDDANEAHPNSVLMSQYRQGLNLELKRGTDRQRAHRSLSPRTSDSNNLEDIVLVEPQPLLQVQPPKNDSTCSTKIPISKPTPIELALSAFKLPSQEPPVITRPIIKRRKTVIQSSKTRLDLNVVGSFLEKEFKSNATATSATPAVSVSTETTPITIDKPAPKVLEEPSQEMPVDPKPKMEIQQMPSSTVQEIPSASLTIESSAAATSTTVTISESPDPAPTNTITTTMSTTNKTSTITTETTTHNTDSSEKSQESLPPLKLSIANRRSGSSKSALGQQLLQAIGLQKLGNRSNNNGQSQSENARDSLRSALKRSLKQAQEQQMKRSKLEEPVKQVADSTTKSTARGSIDDDKHKHNEQATKCNPNSEFKVEHEVVAIKGEKPEQASVSSSDMSPRRRGRKRKDEQDTVALQRNKQELDTTSLTSDRWDDDDELPLKVEQDTPTRSSSSARPARTSKTMSKYYKGPEKTSAKSMHGMGTRASRNRT